MLVLFYGDCRPGYRRCVCLTHRSLSSVLACAFLVLPVSFAVTLSCLRAYAGCLCLLGLVDRPCFVPSVVSGDPTVLSSSIVSAHSITRFARRTCLGCTVCIVVSQTLPGVTSNLGPIRHHVICTVDRLKLGSATGTGGSTHAINSILNGCRPRNSDTYCRTVMLVTRPFDCHCPLVANRNG